MRQAIPDDIRATQKELRFVKAAIEDLHNCPVQNETCPDFAEIERWWWKRLGEVEMDLWRLELALDIP